MRFSRKRKDYLPTCLSNTRNLSFIRKLPETDAADAVVAQIRVGASAKFTARVRARRELRRPLLLEDHRLFGHSISPLRSGERRAHLGEQLTGFFIGFCGGAYDDVHAPDLIDLIIFDFRKN